MTGIVPFLPLIGKTLDRLFPGPEARNEAKIRLLELEQEGQLAELNAELQLMLGQMDVNKKEAISSHWYVAAWRPTVGWVSALSLAWMYVVYPTVTWFGVDAPALDISQLMILLLGMLGIGGMRTFDKVKGKDTTNLS